MKFIVSRTSILNDAKPCDNANYEEVAWIDRRIVSRPEDLAYDSHTWLLEGSNHRVENDMITRDLKAYAWTIEITDIIEFSKQYGEIIITAIPRNYYLPKIEIYDDYRE